MKWLSLFIFTCIIHIKHGLFVETRKCECGKSPISRIVGGTDAPKNKYPWMTTVCHSPRSSVCDFTRQLCGGTLINKLYVLTAAHCFDDIGIKNIVVNIGDWDTSTTSDVKSIQRKVEVIIHENYNSKTTENDIALLKLSRNVVITDEVGPICLPIRGKKTPSYTGVTATVIGWGYTVPNEDDSSPTILKELDIEVISNKACRKQYEKQTSIKNFMMCAFKLNEDSCSGDSGGPLAIKNSTTGKWELIGIVSFGEECADPKFAGVYTRVTSYLNWIDKIIDGTEQCT